MSYLSDYPVDKRLDLRAATALANRIQKDEDWCVALIEVYGNPEYRMTIVFQPTSAEFFIKTRADWKTAQKLAKTYKNLA